MRAPGWSGGDPVHCHWYPICDQSVWLMVHFGAATMASSVRWVLDEEVHPPKKVGTDPARKRANKE